jgi:hypothetical protein
METNPYESPQADLSPVRNQAEAIRLTTGRTIRRYFWYATPLFFICCGLLGAIYNPKSIWSGNEVGRVENFFIHAWPISAAQGVFNMLFWPAALLVIVGGSFIRPLMSVANQFLVFIILIGVGFIGFGLLSGETIIQPMLFGDGGVLIWLGLSALRELKRPTP